MPNAYTEMKADLAKINACGYGLYQTANNVNGSDFAAQFTQVGQNPEAVFVTLHNNIKGTGPSWYAPPGTRFPRCRSSKRPSTA